MEYIFPMKLRLVAVAVITALSLTTLAACGGTETVLPKVTANTGEAPTITKPSGEAPKTLVSEDIIVGTGTEAKADSTLTVHYTLMSWSTGKIAESSWSSGSPATFPLQNLIPGWIQGIPGMKVGGRRLLVIPPDLGYGSSGSGPIAPNETLIFVIDVLAVA
jgi:peptidylprolyl isomerase